MRKSILHWIDTAEERKQIFQEGYNMGKLEMTTGEYFLNPYKGITTWRHSCWWKGFKQGYLDNGGIKFWRGK